MSRPTCATCPHFESDTANQPIMPPDGGDCFVDPPGRWRGTYVPRSRAGWRCRFHPDMPAWIAAKKEPTDG